ncbi:MAG TPA: hypothetical protein VK830_06515, partial [Xanthomonadales bacterium]|nr:hypothetical protein [Xanthomonadales bacterium]
MINGQKLVVVLPAYNADKTLEKTYREIPLDIVDEVTCPTRYFEEASSIRLGASVRYGLGVLRVSLQHLLHRAGLAKIGRYGG